MLVFTVAPARVEYAVEFQIEMTAGIPLAVYAGLRFLARFMRER
jgi:ABC-type phosphate transport system permease subunit